MKNTVLFLLFMLICGCFAAEAGDPKEETCIDREPIDYYPSPYCHAKMANFPGGMPELYSFLRLNIRYPEESLDNNVEGKVLLRFTVCEDGEICDIEVLKSADSFLDAEAIRVVEKMPKWEPGEENGVPVSTKYVLPITFRLIEQNSANDGSSVRKVAED